MSSPTIATSRPLRRVHVADDMRKTTVGDAMLRVDTPPEVAAERELAALGALRRHAKTQPDGDWFLDIAAALGLVSVLPEPRIDPEGSDFPECGRLGGQKLAARFATDTEPGEKHGTRRGYQLHRRRDEDPCDPCGEANARYFREYRAEQKAKRS